MAELRTPDEALRFYRDMQRIRTFEMRLIELFRAAEFAGFLHSSVGQEAVAVGACAALSREDMITANHRSHGHLLAKGVAMNGLLAEIYGKKNGLCGGIAGHVHVADLANGVIGGNGVLGQNQPIAVGAALAMAMDKRANVVVSFFGDGTANEGAVHEAMNLAAVWRLPVIFLCERNEFAELTPYRTHFQIESIAERAKAYGFPGYTVDGTDVDAVAEVVGNAVADARAGRGAALIEARVVRWRGHYEGDSQAYRQDLTHSADPLEITAACYPSVLTGDICRDIEAAAEVEVEAAVKFARDGAYPDPEELFGPSISGEGMPL